MGNEVYENDFDVKAYNDGDFTQDDRKKQFETSMKLFKQLEDLGKVNNKIDKASQEIAKVMENKTISKKLKDQLKAYKDSLDAVRAFIIPTKTTSIFADEERLRERISEVYSSVLSYEGTPNATIYNKIEVLEKEITTVNTRVEKSNKTYLDKVNKMLTDAKLPALTSMTVETSRP